MIYHEEKHLSAGYDDMYLEKRAITPITNFTCGPLLKEQQFDLFQRTYIMFEVLTNKVLKNINLSYKCLKVAQN